MNDRRTVLAGLAASVAAAALPDLAGAEALAPATAPASLPASDLPACRPGPEHFPNVEVRTHEGRRALFYDDLIRGRSVLLHFTSRAREAAYPVLANLARVAPLLGDRLGRDVFIYSIAAEPEADSARDLRELAARHGAGGGWLFLTGEPAAMAAIRGRLFVHDPAAHVHDHAHGHGQTLSGAAAGAEDCSRGLLRYGNEALGLWGSAPATADPAWIAERLEWIRPRTAAADASGAPRRKGPRPLAEQPWWHGATALAMALALSGLALPAAGQTQAPCGPGQPVVADPGATGHPHPQPMPAPPCQTVENGVVVVSTGDSLFPPSRPFEDPPGTNLLPNAYTNLFDSSGTEVPNTLPSTPAVPYNLHDGDPEVSSINPLSPTDDLQQLFAQVSRWTAGRPSAFEAGEVRRALQLGIDILEGNPVPNRAYSGFPLLHFDGPLKLKKVEPIRDAAGKVVGGHVHVRQLWYDGRIESDTNMVDPTDVHDVPWTITYSVDVLNRGEDDFSPYVMYYDAPATAPAVRTGVDLTYRHPHDSDPATPPAPPKPLAGMDQSFFPMQDGTRTVFRVKMAPGRYLSLVYTWGWRMHPPRVQVIENATKTVNGTPLHDFEVQVFGPDPRKDEAAKLAAIGKIGDLAPAKRMWTALRAALAAADRGQWDEVRRQIPAARAAFDDWRQRTELPRGVEADPDSDVTLLYVNNTIYGQLTAGTITQWPDWQTRGATLRVTLLNGDYFDHGYMSVDFGGARGWENQFKSSVKYGGSGCWFTFGRNYFYMNLAGMVTVPAASPLSPWTPTVQKLRIQLNYDPARRLRFYQFDPMHHDVAVFSVH